MSEWRTFRAELRAPKSDLVVLLTTFLLTVLVDLTVAVEVGMVLAAFLFMRRMAEVTNVQRGHPRARRGRGRRRARPQRASRRRTVPPGSRSTRSTARSSSARPRSSRRRCRSSRGTPKVLILRMRNVPAIDSTGLHALRDVVTAVPRRPAPGSSSRTCTRSRWSRCSARRWATSSAEDDLVGNIDDALNAARAHLGLSRSRGPTSPSRRWRGRTAGEPRPPA